MRPHRQRLAAVLLLSLLVGALVGCRPSVSGQDEAPPPITGSGTLEARDVALASELGGPIRQLLVDEGDAVAAGDVLVRLDAAEANTQVAQAQAALAAAQANLAQLQAGARPEELLATRAALDLARAQARGAERALLYARTAISDPVALDLEIAQARMARDLAEQDLEIATAQREATQLNYHVYVELKEPVSQETRDAWDRRLQAAEAAVTQAEAELDAAQAELNALYAQRATPLEALAQLHGAQSAYTATLAAVDRAQAELDQVQAGPRAQELVIAEAQVQQARAALSMAVTSRAMLTLTAPISGVVATRSYHQGEIAPQGLPILTLVDLADIYLTLYVPETRIGEVRPGQPVEVRVDAYPDAVFWGEVTRIAGEAEYTPGNVETTGDRDRRVFAVRVRIPNADRRLRPGIPAQATLRP